MKYCDNTDCPWLDEAIERIDSYHVTEVGVLCGYCHEEWSDTEQENEANRPDEEDMHLSRTQGTRIYG